MPYLPPKSFTPFQPYKGRNHTRDSKDVLLNRSKLSIYAALLFVVGGIAILIAVSLILLVLRQIF